MTSCPILCCLPHSPCTRDVTKWQYGWRRTPEHQNTDFDTLLCISIRVQWHLNATRSSQTARTFTSKPQILSLNIFPRVVDRYFSCLRISLSQYFSVNTSHHCWGQIKFDSYYPPSELSSSPPPSKEVRSHLDKKKVLKTPIWKSWDLSRGDHPLVVRNRLKEFRCAVVRVGKLQNWSDVATSESPRCNWRHDSKSLQTCSSSWGPTTLWPDCRQTCICTPGKKECIQDTVHKSGYICSPVKDR